MWASANKRHRIHATHGISFCVLHIWIICYRTANLNSTWKSNKMCSAFYFGSFVDFQRLFIKRKRTSKIWEGMGRDPCERLRKHSPSARPLTFFLVFGCTTAFSPSLLMQCMCSDMFTILICMQISRCHILFVLSLIAVFNVQIPHNFSRHSANECGAWGCFNGPDSLSLCLSECIYGFTHTNTSCLFT